VKAPTLKAPPIVSESSDDLYAKIDDLHINTPQYAMKPVANSTVRRTPAPDRSPSVKRANTKRRSSGIKQPLGLNLSFGNSPSTVRQFRRVSDRTAEDPNQPSQLPPGMDENAGPKTLFSETSPNSKEAQLGRRAYTKGIGFACQEVLANTGDQEKREAISRLAEAFSDLEMVDPEGLFHILKLSNEKMRAYVFPWP
jgi:serine/threonine-protein kinase 24/25/MST4